MKTINTLLIILSVSVGFLSAVNLYCNDTFLMTSAGNYHTLAIKSDGTLLAWGWNTDGQVGLPENFEFSLDPVVILPGTQWKYICAATSSYGIQKDGTLWVFGADGVERFEVTQIGNDVDWAEIACGDHNNLALKEDGSLFAWGKNKYGSVGNNSTKEVKAPIAILPGERFRQISAGENSSYALHKNGSLYTWGNNIKGQLGNNKTHSWEPVPKIATQKPRWKQISGGLLYTVGLDFEGNVYTWGENSGQIRGYTLAGGAESYTSYHIRVFKDLKFESITAGRDKGYGILPNGSLVGWGYNYRGSLGNGTNEKIYFHAPRIVGEKFAPWKQVSHHKDHTTAINAAGHLYSWGRNKYGRLGFGSIESSIVPKICGRDDVCYAGKCAPWCPEGLENEDGFCVKKDESVIESLKRKFHLKH